MMRTLLLFVLCLGAAFQTTRAELALTKIADAATAVPGAPGTTFKDIGQPFLHSGQVLFHALNNSNAPGLYFYTGMNFLKIADSNTAAPNGGNFTNLSQFAYAVENGVVAFMADDTNGPALFRWTNGVTSRLFKRGDAIPGTATNKFTTFGQPAFDNGTLYFIGADSTNYRGVHRYDTVLSTGLVSSLQNYPGTATPHAFSSQMTVESNRFAVWSATTNGLTNAIFTWSNGVKHLLVSSSDAIPPSGPNFSTFQSPPDLKDGRVAFWGGSAANFQEGIFLRNIDGGAITPVVRRNDPNIGSFGGLTTFNGFATESNKVWFYAGGSGGEGLFFWENNSYRRLLSQGVKLGSRQIASSTSFTFTQNCYDRDVAAFVARFTDNTKALYLTTNLPPTSPALTVTNLVGTNTPLPGGTGVFTSIFGVNLWQGGVVFGGSGANNQGGIYRYHNGVYSVVLDKNGIYPGTSTNYNFLNIMAADAIRLLISAGTASGQLGLFLHDGTTLTPVVDINTAIPGGSFGNFTTFSRAQFNGPRLTIQASGTNSYSGLFEFDGVSLATLVDSTSSFPGGSSFLRVANFTQQGGLLGLVAFDGAGSSLQGLMTYTNGSFTLIATSGAAMPGRPDRALGFFTGLGFFGGQLYFTAQANSTVDAFSGTYLLRAAIGNSNATVVLDETHYFPGLLGGMNSLTLHTAPTGLFFDAGNGSQRGLYQFDGSVLTRLLDNNAAINGSYVSLFSPSAGSFSATSAAFVASTSSGTALLYAPPASTGNPGGQFAPGSIVYSPGGMFCATFGGATGGESYRIQYNALPGSTNWVTLTNFTYAAPLTVCDPSASNQARIYRAVSP
jgi:hypothetical protein